MDSVPHQPGHPTDSVLKEHHLYKMCGSTPIHAPGQERVKGNELGGGIPLCQASRRARAGSRPEKPRLTHGDSREVVGREAPGFERERRPTTSRKKATRPDRLFFLYTQHRRPFADTPVVFPDSNQKPTGEPCILVVAKNLIATRIKMVLRLGLRLLFSSKNIYAFLEK